MTEQEVAEITEREKRMYERLWQVGDYTSQSAYPFAIFLSRVIPRQSKCLEIGCGNGTTMEALRFLGINTVGADITLNGFKKNGYKLFECPAWDMPFQDKVFDYTFSTDTLEHIPIEMLDTSLNEIVRITKFKSIHQIATFKMGHEHKIVKPIHWWKQKFLELDTDVDFLIMERK